MRKEKIRPFRVLSMEGGGLRGLYTALLLDRLNSTFGSSEDLGSRFDLICGVSAGSIIACGLAKGMTCEEIARMYIEYGGKIFPSPRPDKRLLTMFWAWRHRKRAPADSVVLEQLMRKHFHNTTLDEIYKRRGIRLCVPCVDGLTHRPRVFKTPAPGRSSGDGGRTLVEISMASSAAPFLLPAYRHPEGEYSLDAGIWVNSPVVLGMLEALKSVDAKRPIEIINCGAVRNLTRELSDYRPEKGLLDWLVRTDLIEVMMTANGYGDTGIAVDLAAAFCQAGRQVSVLPLEELPKPPEVFEQIKIDSLNKKASDLLRNLALTDADFICRKVVDYPEAPESVMLRNVFSGA